MHFGIGDAVALATDPTATGMVVGGPETGQYLVMFDEDGLRAWTNADHLRKVDAEFRWTRHTDFMADLALLKFANNFSDVILSMGASRTEFLPYQFKPVLQFIQQQLIQQQPNGLLIADEVGLGKTIEAALIAREMIARGSVDRILVVCPANLVEKWKRELHERFDISLWEMRRRDFQSLRARYERERTWPRFFGITSLESLRATDFKNTLAETGVQFDLVIIDEAHHLRNPATRSFELGEALAEQADHILLLSATPVQTGERDLLSLLRLVDLAEFQETSQGDLTARLEPNRYINAAINELSSPNPNLRRVAGYMEDTLGTDHGSTFKQDGLYMSWKRRIKDVHTLPPEVIVRFRRDLQNVHTLAPYYTRTRKRDVQDIKVRRAHRIAVDLTPEERAFYDAWNALVRAEAILRTLHPGFFVAQRERQAASSLHMARDRVESRIASVRSHTESAPDDEYEGSDSEPTDLGRIVGQFHAASTPLDDVIEQLQQAAANLPERDSKIERFVQEIRDLLADNDKRKIICFTEWRGTMHHLHQRLQNEGISCIAISGKTKPEDRARMIYRFRQRDDIRVMVSTEVGSEGIDLQFCDTVINYDLPWNPMRVEQRIGRIDRYGQEADHILVVSFFVKDTIDTRVLQRLYERIGIFEQAIGQLEPILGPAISSLRDEILSKDLSEAEQAAIVHAATLKIHQDRIDREHLEEHQHALMGQGDLLRREVEDTRESGRYISAVEVRAIIERWLASSGSKRNRLDGTSPGFFDLQLSDAMLQQVYDWMKANSAQPTNDASERPPLTGRLSRDGHAWVVFDSELANANPTTPFLHAGHEIVATAIRSLNTRAPDDWITRVGRFVQPEWVRDERPDLMEDGIVLAIYRMRLHGLENQTTMLPIALSLSTGEVLEEDVAKRLMGGLSESRDADGVTGIYENAEIIADTYAFERAEQVARVMEKEAREQQESRIAIRKATLRRSFGARIRRSRERATSVTNESISRLHEGRARRLQGELDDKVHELEHAPEPTADFHPISLAVFVPERARALAGARGMA